MTAPPRAAIVQDWLAAEAGSERCALEFARLLPGASVYTSFFDPGIFEGAFAGREVHSWPLQRLPGAARRFRSFLPAYPVWFSALDLRDYDVVLSSSVAFTHGVRTSRRSLHIAYVHTPLRYAWDLDHYLARSSWSIPARLGARMLAPVLRRWDRRMAKHPDVVVANSETVRARIFEFWGREAEVIYPPVDVDEFEPTGHDGSYYLVAARMLAYRRLDIAVQAASQLNRSLVLVGDGPERRRLESLAGPSVRFAGWVDRAELVRLVEGCRAYLVPGIEDFGMAPVEAMAAGRPVVALDGGGAAETVLDGMTGVLYSESSPQGLARAIERVENLNLDAAAIRARAEEFSVVQFRRRWRELFARLGVDPALTSHL